jgi:hypothetical protein
LGVGIGHLQKRFLEGCYHPEYLGDGRDGEAAAWQNWVAATQMSSRHWNLAFDVPAQFDNTDPSQAGMKPHLAQRQNQTVEGMSRISDLDPLRHACSEHFVGSILGWIWSGSPPTSIELLGPGSVQATSKAEANA